ncbi:uncharacterized protein [Diadema setosum]|uniref:uncharacterized protein n=1 Tax=Diadema setosum TaxID=31175 RepID=UPI003B3B1765
MKLMVDPDVEPVAHHTPVPVPLHWRDAVKAGLDHDVQLGVLEPVPIGEPVTWCHRMVVCAKDGKPCRTVDLQALNAHATRETHHTPSPFIQARSVPHGKKKTVLDAWNGYHSVPLCPEDRHLTTFITPWGTATRQPLKGILPLEMDTPGGQFFQAVEWLDICGRNGITLNPKKFTFGADVMEFTGFEITPVFAHARTLQRAFDESKAAIASEIEEGVRIFDPSKPTCLATDWSKDGISFWLLQKHCSCNDVEPFCCNSGWKIALVGSRFTHAAETRNAPVEGEALAVADALDKARDFVLGYEDLIIAVDHKPLLKISQTVPFRTSQIPA